MTSDQIKVIGNFIGTYQSDLHYIKQFDLYKQEKISIDKFIEKGKHSFYDFLVEFRIVRNFQKGKVGDLLDLVTHWINQPSANNVDEFALFLKSNSLARGQMLTSLSSKVLFLNNPWIIMPIDTQAKNSLSQKTKLYSDFTQLLAAFIIDNKEQINYCLNIIEPFAATIEKDFSDSIQNLKAIRHNRFVDKLLWTNGRVLSPSTPSK